MIDAAPEVPELGLQVLGVRGTDPVAAGHLPEVSPARGEGAHAWELQATLDPDLPLCVPETGPRVSGTGTESRVAGMGIIV